MLLRLQPTFHSSNCFSEEDIQTDKNFQCVYNSQGIEVIPKTFGYDTHQRQEENNSKTVSDMQNSDIQIRTTVDLCCLNNNLCASLYL